MAILVFGQHLASKVRPKHCLKQSTIIYVW